MRRLQNIEVQSQIRVIYTIINVRLLLPSLLQWMMLAETRDQPAVIIEAR